MHFTFSFESTTTGEMAEILEAISNALNGNALAKARTKEEGAKIMHPDNETAIPDNSKKVIPTIEEVDQAVKEVTSPEEPKKKKTKQAKEIKEEPTAEKIKAITHADLKDKAIKLVNANTENRAKIVKLLGEFKAESITKLTADQLPLFNAKLDAFFESDQKQPGDELPF